MSVTERSPWATAETRRCGRRPALPVSDRRQRRRQDRRNPSPTAGTGRVGGWRRERSRCSRRQAAGRPITRHCSGSLPAMSLTGEPPLPAGRRRGALARSPARRRDRGSGRVAARSEPCPDRPRRRAAEVAEGGRGGFRRGPRVRRTEPAGDAPNAPVAEAGSARLRARAGCSPGPSWSGWVPTRCGSETSSRRLALWAGENGRVGLEDLDAMVADTSEAIVWSLADALQQHDPATALAVSGAADRPGRERHRDGLRAGLTDAALARVGPDAGRPKPLPTSKSGAVAAPTTETSWR